MGIPIPVASSPVLISRSVSKPYLLYNAGAQTVYIGLDSSVSNINYAYPLAAGNAIQWAEINSDVYGVCANGQKSSLVITPEASALSIGSVSATVVNPITVGGTVAVGGNVGITGAVDTSGSQVGVSGTVTAKVTPPLLLAQGSLAFGTAGPGSTRILNTGVLDVSTFSSILLTVTQGYTGGATPPLSLSAYVSASIAFGTPQTAPLVPEWLLDANMQNSIQVPVISDKVVLDIFLQKGFVSSIGGAIFVNIYGLTDSIANYKYIGQSQQLKGSIPAGGFYMQAQSNLLTTTDFVASKNGPCVWSALNQGGSGTPGQIQLGVIKGGGNIPASNNMLFQNNAPAGGGNTQILAPLLPPLPAVVTTYSYASASVQTTLMQ